MNNMPLNCFFNKLKNESYCLVKSYQLVDYPTGSDIDIFCYDIKKMIDCLTRVGQQYVQKYGYEIVITNRESHAFVDFYSKKQLIIRFDLYDALPHYKRVRVKEAFFSAIIENHTIIEMQFPGEEMIPVKVAMEQDDLILRYIEYIEYYLIRPDKVKHLEFILNKLDETPGKINYLDRLHYYTDFPRYEKDVLYISDASGTEELGNKKNREVLRELQGKLDSVEERYQRLLLVAQTDFEKIELPSKLIIYGAGNIGKVFYQKIKGKCEIECFLDMYSEDTEYEGVPIVSLHKVSDVKGKNIVVIPTYDFCNIKEQLMEIYDEATSIIPLDELFR